MTTSPKCSRCFLAALRPGVLLLAGAIQLHAIPPEAHLRERVKEDRKFQACVANSTDAYLDASELAVDPARKQQATPEAEEAYQRCDLALDRLFKAGFCAWDQALDDCIENMEDESAVEDYRKAARPALKAWLKKAIVESVVARARAEFETR